MLLPLLSEDTHRTQSSKRVHTESCALFGHEAHEQLLCNTLLQDRKPG